MKNSFSIYIFINVYLTNSINISRHKKTLPKAEMIQTNNNIASKQREKGLRNTTDETKHTTCRKCTL